MITADIRNKLTTLKYQEEQATQFLKEMDNTQIFTPAGKKLWKERSDIRGEIAELEAKLDAILQTRVNIDELNEDSIGDWVIYLGDAGEKEKGKIKSWNDKYVFVVYKCGDNWERFKDYTAVATHPEQLMLFSKYQELKKAQDD